MSTYPPPVYPKPNPEWEKKRKEILYEQIKKTSWKAILDEDGWKKPKGRKPKFKERPKAQPRKGEKSWFDQ